MVQKSHFWPLLKSQKKRCFLIPKNIKKTSKKRVFWPFLRPPQKRGFWTPPKGGYPPGIAGDPLQGPPLFPDPGGPPWRGSRDPPKKGSKWPPKTSKNVIFDHFWPFFDSKKVPFLTIFNPPKTLKKGSFLPFLVSFQKPLFSTISQPHSRGSIFR